MKLAIACLGLAAGWGAPPDDHARQTRENAVIDLWMDGKTAFGVFVPNENAPPRGTSGAAGSVPTTPAGPPSATRGGPPGAAGVQGRGGSGRGGPPPLYTRNGGERLAMNPLYDYVFLNLEGTYDLDAVRALAEGLRSPKAVSRKTLIVRIPTIARDGVALTRARVKDVLDAGADGVTLPHIRSVEEARLAISFFKEAGANVWSPSNPRGETLAMLMIEDPGALAQAAAIADLPGYSVLACGIGSLTQALGGDREAAEAGNQKILAESQRVRLPNMLTASPQDVELRVTQGYLALLGQGPSADEMIRIGRAAAGR